MAIDVASSVTMLKGIPPGYNVLHRCGEGTFGQVYLCTDASGRHVAIKTIKQETAKQVRHHAYGEVMVQHTSLQVCVLMLM